MTGGGGKIEQRVVLTRQETARWLHEIANAIEAGGSAGVALVGPTVSFDLPEEFEVELELEPYGDKIELEFELSWPNPGTSTSSDAPRSTVSAPQPLR